MRCARRGFTLTELLIVIALGSMLMLLGAPTLGGLLARTRMVNAATSIVRALHAARTTAVTRGTRVIMCPSRDARHCRSGDDWQHGWLIATDRDHDGQPDAGTDIISVRGSLHAGTRVITSEGRGKIAFHPLGSASGSNVSFTICQRGQAQGESVIVANSGRIRAAAPEPDRLAACLAGLQ